MSLELGTMLEAAQRTGPPLLDIAGRGVLILAFAGIVDLAMRRASAAARHWVWLLAIVGLFMLPLVSSVLPRWRVLPVPASLQNSPLPQVQTPSDSLPAIAANAANSAPFSAVPSPVPSVVPTENSLQTPARTADPAGPPHLVPTAAPMPPEETKAAAPPMPATILTQASADPAPLAVPPAGIPHAESSPPSPPPAAAPAESSPAVVVPAPSRATRAAVLWATLLGIWLAGTLVLLARLLLGFASLHALQRRSTRLTQGDFADLLQCLAAQMQLRRPVELLSGSTRAMPMTWGLWRTRILLPFQAAQWPPEQLRAVLLHELSHARRRDCLTQFLVQIACALYWPNPLVWLARRRMEIERERACDDLVLNTGAKASAYAEHLLHSASEVSTMKTANIFRMVGPAVAMARPSALEQRLRAILDPRRNRNALTPAGAAAAAALLLMALLPVAVLHAASAAPAPRAGEPFSPAEVERLNQPTATAAAARGGARGADPDSVVDSELPPDAPPARAGGGGVTGGRAGGGARGGNPGGFAGASGRGLSGGPVPGRSGDAGMLDAPAVNLDATIYDLRIAPELIGRLDIDALTKAAASAEAFEKALSDLGTAKPLYRATQAVRLSGDMIRIGSSTPYVTNSQVTAQGQTVNTVQYTSTGAIFNISGEWEEVPPRINLALGVEISTLTEGAAQITSTVKASVMRNVNLSRNGFVELHQPFVILSIDGASADSAGKAVAYVARVSLSRPESPGSAAPPAAPIVPSTPGVRGAGERGN